jgi:hypothetical protein
VHVRNGSLHDATAYATVTFDAAADRIPVTDVSRVIDTAQAARSADLQVELGGQAISAAAEAATEGTEALGVVAAGIILFVAFGSLLGMLVPLLVAIAALGAGLITVGLTSHLMTLGSITPTVAALTRAGELLAGELGDRPSDRDRSGVRVVPVEFSWLRVRERGEPAVRHLDALARYEQFHVADPVPPQQRPPVLLGRRKVGDLRVGQQQQGGLAPRTAERVDLRERGFQQGSATVGDSGPGGRVR